ncbi:MAG: hypothetical protein RQ801_07940 [Spirochaetaceae bacterium]|nr:hypothetical protein [Spirochaetaceae bacterium]MDT8298212.1 hypothetical protein [Spirochaetaceae bacterium]
MMFRREIRILLVGLVASFLTFGVGAQAVLTDVRFTPPTFFVGDHVNLLIEFSLDSPLAVDVPDNMPESDWAEIRDISVQQTEDTVSITIAFTPFAPGTRTLPDMELGALQIRDIKVPTHSILDSAHEGVRSLRGQLLMPGTRLAVALILAFTAMAPFLFFGLVRFIIKWVKRSRDIYRIGRPARKLKRLIKRLRSAVGSATAPYWYSDLTDGIRIYLGSRIDYDCRSATTAEIAVLPHFSEPEKPQGKILEVLQDGDMVKFGGRFADDKRLLRTLDSVESAVKEWEKSHAQL